jgi:hypothetical protein
MSIMPLLDCFRVLLHTDWSLSSEYFFLYTFTENFNVYSEVCRYPKKSHFYPILGNLPRFGKHCFISYIGIKIYVSALSFSVSFACRNSAQRRLLYVVSSTVQCPLWLCRVTRLLVFLKHGFRRISNLPPIFGYHPKFQTIINRYFGLVPRTNCCFSWGPTLVKGRRIHSVNINLQNETLFRYGSWNQHIHICWF